MTRYSLHTGCTLLLLLVMSLFMTSCGNQAVELTSTDNNTLVQVQLNNKLIIDLTENDTTGYRWAVNQNDSSILAFQGSTYTPGQPGNETGKRTFTFMAKSQGTVHLQLKLWRSFEGDSSIVQRYNVTIHV